MAVQQRRGEVIERGREKSLQPSCMHALRRPSEGDVRDPGGGTAPGPARRRHSGQGSERPPCSAPAQQRSRGTRDAALSSSAGSAGSHQQSQPSRGHPASPALHSGRDNASRTAISAGPKEEVRTCRRDTLEIATSTARRTAFHPPICRANLDAKVRPSGLDEKAATREGR